ncbi:septal ring lytic transglycosylase RlpA family protein [Bosea sp. (in: a-proteobacteria)]|uniref:septal ring lytic transglycosylase RlpA family protein n=1 Tax=Bosea sp. (in: a-proteobacteria) TaxID=1871050 RepID=UPI00262B805E|nr:septal ring lytic transglycosylase RlpA family protein [Bosea sp. (in: a-proteobacteria)]MCO5093347.1 septal ring lytic transglycosylase RlpA family protein [Bosea sp. (in: a-proteobacteria)]
MMSGPMPASSCVPTVARLGCVVLAGLFAANCAGNQVAGRRSKEIGAFPQAKYGTASPRVVAEGEDVPKGGGRQLIGKAYSVAGKRYVPFEKPVGYAQVGTASWYGEAFHGRRTANGEIYDRHSVSAAHPTMPLPAYARVTNLMNSRSIIVRVNDRGPFHGGRMMDLSQATADALAFRHLGTARIKMEYLGQASLAGSDDKLLLATLRTDGTPAPIPGTSARTMVASAEPVATTRTRSVDLDAPPAAEPAPVATPVVQAYAPPQPRTITPSAPVVATLASAVSTPVEGPSLRTAPLPPNRPFDLDTIAGAARPVVMPATLRTTLPPPRANLASLFAAPEKGAAGRLAKTHPLNRLAPQPLQPLARN